MKHWVNAEIKKLEISATEGTFTSGHKLDLYVTSTENPNEIYQELTYFSGTEK